MRVRNLKILVALSYLCVCNVLHSYMAISGPSLLIESTVDSVIRDDFTPVATTGTEVV